jgi:hypothetical protein
MIQWNHYLYGILAQKPTEEREHTSEQEEKPSDESTT